MLDAIGYSQGGKEGGEVLQALSASQVISLVCHFTKVFEEPDHTLTYGHSCPLRISYKAQNIKLQISTTDITASSTYTVTSDIPVCPGVGG